MGNTAPFNTAPLNAELFDTDGAIDMGSRRDLDAMNIPFYAPEPVVASVQQATQAVQGLGLKPLMLGDEPLINSGAEAAPGIAAWRCCPASSFFTG
jgi:hypothetical protein